MDTIAICKDNYDNEELFWKDIAMIIDILTRNKNEIALRYEGCGIYIINFVAEEVGQFKFHYHDEEYDEE